MRSKVLFPAPLGPIRAVILLEAIDKLGIVNTSREPKLTVTFAKQNAGVVISGVHPFGRTVANRHKEFH